MTSSHSIANPLWCFTSVVIGSDPGLQRCTQTLKLKLFESGTGTFILLLGQVSVVVVASCDYLRCTWGILGSIMTSRFTLELSIHGWRQKSGPISTRAWTTGKPMVNCLLNAITMFWWCYIMLYPFSTNGPMSLRVSSINEHPTVFVPIMASICCSSGWQRAHGQIVLRGGHGKSQGLGVSIGAMM